MQEVKNNLLKNQSITYSLIVCAKNEAENIGEFLDSVKNLDIPSEAHISVIIVDDGSTDKTVEIARQTLQGIAVLPSNGQGVAAARNTGLSITDTDYAIFSDCDGILDTQMLWSLHSTIKAYSFPDVIQGNIWSQYHRSPYNNYLAIWREISFKERSGFGNGLPQTFHGRLLSLKMSFVRRLSHDLQPFDENLVGAGAEDLECGYRACQLSTKIVLDENAIIYHKDPPNFVGIVRKRYRAGVADGRAGIGKHLLDVKNLYSAGIRPIIGGTPFWFSLGLWLAYTLGSHQGKRSN